MTDQIQQFTKLNVGCGFDIMPAPWCNLDREALPGVDCIYDFNEVDVRKPPFDNNQFDEILMAHVLEHLPNPLDVMYELYRLAKPGALLTIRVPYGSSDAAFEDPQHVRQYFLQSFEYFGQPAYHKADYGYRGDWLIKNRTLIIDPSIPMVQGATGSLEDMMQLITHARNVVSELYVELEAVKPRREPLRELGVAGPIQFSFITNPAAAQQQRQGPEPETPS